jgi:hypothetical protein
MNLTLNLTPKITPRITGLFVTQFKVMILLGLIGMNPLAQASVIKSTDLILFQSNKYEDLLSVANDKTVDFETRWKAVMQMTDSNPTKAMADLRGFLTAKEWFIRNAAMVAINEVNPAEGKVAAIKLLSDKALVVRSAAVQMLESHIDTQVRIRLWQELSAGYNFRKKQSLWVRGQILSLLSKKPLPSEKKQFEALKTDSDKRVSAIANNVILN